MTAFGSTLAPVMVSSRTQSGVFGAWQRHPADELVFSPAAHVLHYGSACFEGLKAHRGADGVVRLFRLPAHAARLRQSAAALCLPVPDADLAGGMIRAVVAANLGYVPATPGALYVRPALVGTDPTIGAAATASREALLFVVASPVGDYFAERALTVAVETALPRTTPQFGGVKAGANYAQALGVIEQARARHGADQVLFAPGGAVGETGASNVLLLDVARAWAVPADGSVLEGVTRDSLLHLARELGYEVREEQLSVDDLLAWAEHGEIALVGTAAGAAGVGTLVVDGRRVQVGGGAVGPHTQRLRAALAAVQGGRAPDHWGWTEPVRDDVIDDAAPH